MKKALRDLKKGDCVQTTFGDEGNLVVLMVDHVEDGGNHAVIVGTQLYGITTGYRARPIEMCADWTIPCKVLSDDELEKMEKDKTDWEHRYETEEKRRQLIKEDREHLLWLINEVKSYYGDREDFAEILAKELYGAGYKRIH